MKRNVSSVFWGLLFLLVGAALLANQMGWVNFSLVSTNTWAYFFAGLSLVFFISYFVNGLRQWGWLFPALIFAALSLTVWFADRDLHGSYIGMPILLSVALPFYVGFALDRKAWGLLIPAWVLSVLAIVTLTADLVEGSLVGSLFLYAVAAPFLVVYLRNRLRWWSLIVAWVMFVLGTITLLSDHINGNLVGAMFLYSVALPFLVVYLFNRTLRWALIPAAALAVVGTLPLLASVASGDWMGAAVMLLFSAPFFFVYFRWPEHWWALIPGGVFASIGLVVMLGMLVPRNQPVFEGLLNGILLLGLSLTFGALWLLRGSWPTAWARYPAIGLLIAAVLAGFSGGISALFWAGALLVGGIVLVVYSFLRKKPEGLQQPPEDRNTPL
jgi:hypothetical protein